MPTRNRVTGAGTGTPLAFGGQGDGTGSGGVDARGTFTVDPLGFQRYPYELQSDATKAEHVNGQGATIAHHAWEWDTDRGQWIHPINDTTISVAADLGGPFAAYAAGAGQGAHAPSSFMGPIAPSAAPTAATVAPNTIGPTIAGAHALGPGFIPAVTGGGGAMGAGAAANPYLWMALANIGSSAISGALAPQPQQRQSFDGTGADPTAWMTQLRQMLGDTYGAAVNRANDPISVGGMPVDLTRGSDGSFGVPPLNPSFNNPDLPWPITGPTTRPGAYAMPGAGIPAPPARTPTNTTFPGAATTNTPARVPTTFNPASASAPITAQANTPTTDFGGTDLATAAPTDTSSPDPRVQGLASARLLLHALQGTS